ncbi:MAG: hypothetical protein P0Y62_02735 [Candidatus Chryseobacterium colombiense]|nr:hypothetical protein [Chryseobacterium sp.]WEK70472.1 MAG: hypothetical protein P0Y62_02735 [Chryseobacterium sp.]
MRKNENPNFINVRPKGTPWKLGLFFLWGFILFSNPLFALSETNSGKLTDSIRTTKEVQKEANVLYIEKGAFIYGMENVTQTITYSHNTEKNSSKTLPKKKKTAVKKKLVKHKAVQQVPKPKISVVLSSPPYEESFSLGKKISAVATITLNPNLKSTILTNPVEVFKVPSFKTNSSHYSSLFIIRDISDTLILTRPPPSLF